MDYSHLGLRFSMDRYGPVWSRQQTARLLWACIGVSSLLSGFFIILALLFTENKLLILVFCFWGYGVAIATILKNYFRATSEIKNMLMTYAICPTLPLVAQAATFYFWGFNSFLIITAVTSIAAASYLLIKFRDTAVDAWRHVHGTLRLVRSASSTLLINSIFTFLTFSIDRIILNLFSPKTIVGEYSIILFSFALLLTIPSTLAEFIFPKVIRATVDSGRYFYPREILTIFIPTGIFATAAYFMGPYLITKFTPYGHLAQLIQLVVIGVLPYAITPILFHVMNALDMRTHLLVSAGAVLGIYSLALLWGGVYVDNKLEYFTVTRVLCGYALVCAYFMCLKLCRRSHK